MQQKRLTLSERYKISILLEEGYSQSEISRRLSRDRTVIYREIKRNSIVGIYTAEAASQLAIKRSETSHRTIKFTADVRDLVIDMLNLDWSPEQISYSLKRDYQKSLSIQRIYEFVAFDKSEGGELYKHLRHGVTKRRKKYGTSDTRGLIKDRVSIDERPSIVDRKCRVGDYEIDTVIGKAHKGALVTIVDRKSKYTLIGKVDSKESNGVANTLIDLLEPYKDSV